MSLPDPRQALDTQQQDLSIIFDYGRSALSTYLLPRLLSSPAVRMSVAGFIGFLFNHVKPFRNISGSCHLTPSHFFRKFPSPAVPDHLFSSRLPIMSPSRSS